MDTLQLLIDKVERFEETSNFAGLKAVIQHIEIAETYIDLGQRDGNDFMFTDVIYRTNHAFEGILKEAFSILEGKDASKKTPYQIETYLTNHNVFNSRVMDLFTNYRKEWRNPSTHEHKLSFSEQEAFLALLSVIAFISILLVRMLTKVAYDAEKALTTQEAQKINTIIKHIRTLPLKEKIIEASLEFINSLKSFDGALDSLNEAQIMGMMGAYYDSVLTDIERTVEPHTHLGDITRLYGDFLFGNESGNKVLIEVKRQSTNFSKNVIVKRALQQIIQFFTVSGIKMGIVFLFPQSKNFDVRREVHRYEQNDEVYEIVVIYPEYKEKDAA